VSEDQVDLDSFEGDRESLSGAGSRLNELQGLQMLYLDDACVVSVVVGPIEVCEERVWSLTPTCTVPA